MKTLWKITLTTHGALRINMGEDTMSIRADFCGLSKNDSLVFTNTKGAVVVLMVREQYWVMVEQIYEDGESENAANYNAYKELEKDD